VIAIVFISPAIVYAVLKLIPDLRYRNLRLRKLPVSSL